MLIIDDQDTRPRDVEELIGTTRENKRQFADYDSILARLGMRPLSLYEGRTILEVGTGVGNALRGAYEHFGPSAHIVSLDLDEGAIHNLARTTDLPAELVQEIRARPSDNPRIDIAAASIETVKLPREYFDFAYAIWVLYQVKDKLSALRNVLSALRVGAPLVMVASGSICTVSRRLGDDLIQSARQFVWSHRASRFSWLTGVRELEHFLKEAGEDHRVESVDSFLARRFDFEILSRAETSEFPAGNFSLERPADERMRAFLEAELELIGFVSTKNSAFVPIYFDPAFDS